MSPSGKAENHYNEHSQPSQEPAKLLAVSVACWRRRTGDLLWRKGWEMAYMVFKELQRRHLLEKTQTTRGLEFLCLRIPSEP